MGSLLFSGSTGPALIDLTKDEEKDEPPDCLKTSPPGCSRGNVSPIAQGSPFLKPLSHLQGGRDFYLSEGDTREVDAFGLSDWCCRVASQDACQDTKVLIKPIHLAYHVGCFLSLHKKKSLVSLFNDRVFALYGEDMHRAAKKAFWCLEEDSMGGLLVKTPPCAKHGPKKVLPSKLYLCSSDDWKAFASLVNSYKVFLPAPFARGCAALAKPKNVAKAREGLISLLTHKSQDWIFGSTGKDKDGKTVYSLAGLIKTRTAGEFKLPAFGTLVIRCK